MVELIAKLGDLTCRAFVRHQSKNATKCGECEQHTPFFVVEKNFASVIGAAQSYETGWDDEKIGEEEAGADWE